MTPLKTHSETFQGHVITMKWFFDDSSREPWLEHDGHGVVSGWEHRDKLPSERVLCSERSSRRFYDMAATMKQAKAEGWGLDAEAKAALALKLGHAPAAGEVLAASVEADFLYLKRWCNDGWCWVGYKLTVSGLPSLEDSLWGIESDSMAEFQADNIAHAKEAIAKELAESFRAACADVATVNA